MWRTDWIVRHISAGFENETELQHLLRAVSELEGLYSYVIAEMDFQK